MKFRPCIDIHNGCVKQIVGGSLTDNKNQAKNNFVSEKKADFYANMYKKDGFKGGHIIILNPAGSTYYNEDIEQAKLALAAYPGGMQIGGGVNTDNAEKYLDMGHLEILVLGESLLDGGRWEQVLEYLKQEPTIGENVYVFRCAVASEAVAWVSPQDVSLGEYLLGLLEINPNGSPGQAVTLREVYHEFYERGALSELPELKIYGKELEVKF